MRYSPTTRGTGMLALHKIFEQNAFYFSWSSRTFEQEKQMTHHDIYLLSFSLLLFIWFHPTPAHSLLWASLPFRRGGPRHETPLSKCWDDPVLAVITEPDACATDERTSQTLSSLRQALTVPGIDLISIRVTRDCCPDRVVNLIQELMSLVQQTSNNNNNTTKVVVTSDWMDAAVAAGAHGIHVKQAHQSKIPDIRHQFAPQIPLIGTSVHSVEAAIDAVQRYQPDYLLVGTCYPTETHPEKSKADLEGPELPGKVAKAIGSVCPVLAIGGINTKNCAEPIVFGASGVATIRAIMQAKDPATIVQDMVNTMKQVY